VVVQRESRSGLVRDRRRRLRLCACTQRRWILEGYSIGASEEAQFQSHLGLADLFEGHHRQARYHLRRALALSRGIRWWIAAQEALAGLATVAAIEGRDKDATMLARAAHVVSDKPLSHFDLHIDARLNALSNGLIGAARDQPAPTPQQLEAILRDASEDHAIEEPAVPDLP
jgi:hypothetical protein